MNKRSTVVWVAIMSLAAFFLLVAKTYWQSKDELPSASRGEEVYASHDCTDCHLSAQVLRQKKAKNDVGLIRVRKDLALLLQFLQTDRRHDSYSAISAQDRADLTEYLKSLTD